MKTLPMSFRMEPEAKVALEAAAKADSRSVTSLVSKIVNDWLREHGHLPK